MKMVYLSPVPWSSITQRPHFFVDAALRNDVESVLWIDPYPTRFPNIGDFHPGRHAPEPVGMGLPKGLNILKPDFILPCEPLPIVFKLLNSGAINKIFQNVGDFIDSDTLLVVGKPSLLALKLIDSFKWKKKWFDAMDDFPQFYVGLSKFNMIKTENKIICSVDEIICSSHALLEKFSLPDKTKLILNACSDTIERSSDSNTDNKFVFGYIGTIAQWFDWTWVVELSKLNPDSLIRIIGPIKTSVPTNLPKNIKLEMAIEHSKVMSTIATFDVAIIPFMLNEITKCVDPVKFYEYLLARKDIVSTAFGEMNYHYHSYVKNDVTINYKLPSGSLFFPFSSMSPAPSVPRWNDRFQTLFI